MADKKISQLTGATTPLAGTEVLPIVQGGSTVKVSVDNLTAGKAVTADSVTATTLATSPAAAGSNLTGTAFSADGTDANINLNIVPKGTGIVTVGNSTANDKWYNTSGYTAQVQVEKSFSAGALAAQYVRAGLITNVGDSNGSIFGLAKSRGTTDGSATIVQDGDTLGVISFQGADGTEFVQGALIAAIVDATPGANDMPTRLSFRTTADGSATPTERLQISNAGNVTVSTGDLVVGTAAKGINFSANTPSTGSTSQLLNWYEEGTWTPNQGPGLTVVGAFSSNGKYSRIGRLVIASGEVIGATSVACAAAGAITTNLPITVGTVGSGAVTVGNVNQSSTCLAYNTQIYCMTAITATAGINFTVIYIV
jgi:hypothetical protein